MAPPSTATPTPAPPFPAWRAAVGVLTLTLVVATGLLFLGLWNSGWFGQVPREFEPEGLPCVVEMPGGVHEATLLPGQPATGSQYAVRRRFPWESFGLAARELPDDFDEDADDPLPAMDATLRDFLKSVPGGVAPPIVTVPDADALVRQASIATPKYGNVIARVVHGGPRLYLLVVAGKAVTPDRPDVANFFGSFRATDDTDRASAAAALARAAESGKHRAAWDAFDRQPYGGGVPPDPSNWPGLTHQWRCDGPPLPTWLDGRGGAHGTWNVAPGSASGPRGQAVAFGNGAALTATLAAPIGVVPRGASTLTFWYRANPGDGRLLDLQPDHEAGGTIDLIANEIVVKLPAPIPAKPREVRLPRPADADWHHVAVVRRADPEPAALQVWFDGELAHDGPPPTADDFTLETNRVWVGGPAGERDKPTGRDGAFRAALDEVCLFARALTDAELRRLAAAPEPPAVEPYWLRPDSGLPKPLAYLAWAPATARTGRQPDAAGRRTYAVNGPVRDTDSPAGRGYALTPTPPEPAVALGPWRFGPTPRQGPVGEVTPFTVAVWASYDGAAPLELLTLGDLRLTVTSDEARVDLKPGKSPEPPAFVAEKLAAGWHHYTLTRSRTGVVAFYLDGVGVPGTFEVSGTDGRTPSTVALGTFPRSATLRTFEVSEFVIFAAACTPAEVRRIAAVKVVE